MEMDEYFWSIFSAFAYCAVIISTIGAYYRAVKKRFWITCLKTEDEGEQIFLRACFVGGWILVVLMLIWKQFMYEYLWYWKVFDFAFWLLWLWVINKVILLVSIILVKLVKFILGK